MRNHSLYAFVVASVIGFSFAACNCGGGGDGPPDGNFLEDGGVCIPVDGDCSTGTPCCGRNACVEGVCRPTCEDPGSACTSGSECCFNRCLANGTCGDQCKDIAATCANAEECCTNVCDSTGHCADIAGRPTGPDGGAICEVRGSACESGAECCSTNCKFNVCVPAYTCGAYNDVCSRNNDCCSLSCSVNDGGFGYCITVSGGGAGTCSPAGNPCSDGDECCTFVCSDLGSGARVCQPVSGCQVAGDPCNADSNCCGGAPQGDVVCRPSTRRCDQGGSCREPGNICGRPLDYQGNPARLPDGGIFVISSETNCCPGFPGDDPVCHVDSTGVPRCFGGHNSTTCPYGYTGTAPCCVDVGQFCNFRDECCNGAACVAGVDGARRCERATCSGVGTSCDPADAGTNPCCNGTQCLATSELSFACQVFTEPCDGGACACRANGSNCSGGAQCCSEICNAQGKCEAPAVCQPQSAGCSVSADCCSGLTCNTPVGGGASTCQPGATCPAAGQACSPTSPCCNQGTELQCLTAAGASCDGTTACACEFIFGKQSSAVAE